MVKHTFSKILLLSEGSDVGMAASRAAIALAADEEAELIIMAVVDTHTLKQLLTNRIFVEEEMEQYEKDIESSSRKQVDYVGQLATKAGVDYRSEVVTGACHTAVLEEQVETGADLLVMGGYEATMIKGDLMAREKQLILDEITCPVLLVPPAMASE